MINIFSPCVAAPHARRRCSGTGLDCPHVQLELIELQMKAKKVAEENAKLRADQA